jgi:integrase
MSTCDVQFWDIRRKDGRRRPWEVRRVVAGREKSRSFVTKALADGFRSQLVQAARSGEPFDEQSGLPKRMARDGERRSWYEHARAYAEMKWPLSAAKSRRMIAEALATVTPALVTSTRGAPAPPLLRKALYRYAFNPAIGHAERPDEVVEALAWIQKASVDVSALSDPSLIRKALSASAVTLDGRPAAATTLRRKRAVLYNALGYAVELQLLDSNPIDRIQWKAAEVAATVDRRVVANPDQVRFLLAGVREQRMGERLVAFFGCLYFAGMRPAEALALRESNCILAERGWGRLNLTRSEPRAGVEWTDDGAAREVRGLKHRGQRETRSVPIPPELVRLLRDHIERLGVGPDGRLFRTGRNGAIQDGDYAEVWRNARRAVLTPEQVDSPLARRPYDLRHAAISLWLNAGVPATEVARRAGHGVAVMLSVYANCVDGQEQVANERIEHALSDSTPEYGRDRGSGHDRLNEVSDGSPVETDPAGQSRDNEDDSEPPKDETAGGGLA